MRRIRKATVALGSGSTVMDLTQHVVEKSATAWCSFLFTLTQLRDGLGKMGKESTRAIVDASLEARGAEIHQGYSFDTFHKSKFDFAPQVGARDRQQQVAESRLFGTDGMVGRSLVFEDRLSRAEAQLMKLSEPDRQMFAGMVAVTTKEEAKLMGFHKISPTMQIGPASEASFDFFTAADALDKVSTEYFRLAGVSPILERSELFTEKITSAVTESKAASGMAPADLLLLQVKFVCQEADLEMLRAAAGAVEQDYANLTGKALNAIPKPVGQVGRFHEKVAMVARTLEDMKGSSEFMVNEDGEQAVIITEADLEANMENLARSLRGWSEGQILTGANAQVRSGWCTPISRVGIPTAQ